jgi:hypothetical protein
MDMSLFFEDEIEKVKRKMDPSGLAEMRSQDPRLNGQLEKLHAFQRKYRAEQMEASRRRQTYYYHA